MEMSAWQKKVMSGEAMEIQDEESDINYVKKRFPSNVFYFKKILCGPNFLKNTTNIAFKCYEGFISHLVDQTVFCAIRFSLTK